MNKLLAFISLLAYTCGAHATDISGIISGRFDAAAQNASVTVVCGDFKKTEYTNMAGTYYVDGVPDNSSCSVTIEWQNLRSKPQEIKTTSGTLNFSRSVEPYEGHLHILDTSIN